MSDEFEWVVEYETLPPEDEPLFEEERPRRRRRRLPRWARLAIIAAVIVGVGLYALWRFGDQAVALPAPDTPQGQIESVVQLEINAVLTGDEVLLDQYLGEESRTERLQPPREVLLSAQQGDASLLDGITPVRTEMLEEGSAVTYVELTWDGTPYCLKWYHTKVNNRWVHVDWQPVDLGTRQELRTPHLVVEYHAKESEQAAKLTAQVELYLTQLCLWLDCPDEPFAATVQFDRYAAEYYVTNDGHLDYRLPSPWRIRWPLDNEPEPLVFASLARRLAYDLSAPNWVATGLSPENTAALRLATAWLAHHLLNIDQMPSVRWLDEVAARDGLRGVVAFIQALTQDVAPQEALEASLTPETVAAVTAEPDYFGWLILVMDPRSSLLPTTYTVHGELPPWRTALPQRLDRGVDPWAPAEGRYASVAPTIETVRFEELFAVATGDQSGGWPFAYYFRPEDGRWLPTHANAEYMGEWRTVQGDRFTLGYYAWDESYIAETMRHLSVGIQSTLETFDLELEGELEYHMVPTEGSGAPEEPDPDILYLPSPAAAYAWTSGADLDYYRYVALGGAIGPLEVIYPVMQQDAWALGYGLILWQVDQVAGKLGLEYNPRGWLLPALIPEDELMAMWGPLEEIWGEERMATSPESVTADVTQAQSVIEYLVERYGRSVLPTLLESMGTAGSVAEWVEMVTGNTLEAEESAWEDWLITH